MITRVLMLAMVLAINFAVTTPALANQQDEPPNPPNIDIGTATPIEGYPDYEITDKGFLVYQRDVIVGKCGSPQDFAFQSKSLRDEAASACERAGYSASLTETGGLPVILVPIVMLVAGGLLIRKSIAG